MTELWRLSGLELRRMIIAREVKPSEIMVAILARIEKLNPRLNAFCTIAHDSAMAEALRADEKMVAGKGEGLLFGLPVSIKDLIFTQGIRTTFASKMHKTFVPDQDGVVVGRLKAAGAIVIGKTNSCEYGYKAVTDSPLWGITRNPWNLEMTPAGSSGGAGAGVAAGMGPLALGSDSGGSVRAPASFCGIFGLKSSRGRIPLYPLLPGWQTAERRLAHYGPLTRTVADAAMMMEVMAGPDDRDPLSLPAETPRYLQEMKKGVRGLRIVWSEDLGHVVVDPVVRKSVEDAAHIFSTMGCEVEEAVPDFPSMHDPYRLLFAADCAGALGARLDEWKDRLDPGLVKLTEIGLKVSAVDYVRAANQCHVLWDRLEPFFAKYDLLLTPTLPLPPFPVGIDWPREVAGQKVHPLNYLGFTYPFNLTGQPAASLPCAWTADGLPIGLQIVGRRFEDVTVLKAAAAFEEVRPWKDRWPGLCG